MNEKLVYRFALLISLLTLVCLAANYYIYPLPTHDGVWTLTPVFSAIQGFWTEDIFTGYRLPFLHYYLKIPFYLVMGNSIYGPFILNIIINLLYVFIIVKYGKKYNLLFAQIWVIVVLVISCNTFTSLRPEHLINVLLLLYFLNHRYLKFVWQNILISFLFIAIHPAAGLFALLFNLTHSTYHIKSMFIQLGILLFFIAAFYLLFTEHALTLFYALQARYEGNLLLPIAAFVKSCMFLIIYYAYRLYFNDNAKKELLQLLAFMLLATVLGKDYYFDYVVIFILYQCITMPLPSKNYYTLQLVLVFTSFCIFPFRHLYCQLQNEETHSNLKQVLNKIGEVVSQNDKTYQVPMEFALPAVGNKNVKLLYHNLENDTYTPLVRAPHAVVLVTNPDKFMEAQKSTGAPIRQWVQPLGNQKYCLFEIPALPH